MTARVTTTAPLGAVVEGVDLAAPDERLVEDLPRLLAERGVVVFTGQSIDDAVFVAFLRRFGPLAFTTGETPVAGYPDLNIVSNVGRNRPPRSTFHVDTSYVARPPAYTALRAVRIPERGGDTLFTDQYLAYDTLPGRLKDWLAGRTIRHVVTGLTLDSDAETEADHPVFRPHPVSGRTALYLTAQARCQGVSGLSAQEAADVVAELLAHSTRPENVLRHAWAAGDVVMWDNGCVMHRADHDGVQGDRVLHRGMVVAA